MSFDHVCLDMDGVLCDLNTALWSLFGRMEFNDNTTHPRVHEHLGISFKEAWQKVVDAGYEFWADLAPYPWTFELIAFAKQFDSFSVVTTPIDIGDPAGRDIGNCVRGKTMWLRSHLGADFHDVVFTQNKALLSRPGVLLIDDMEHHTAAFLKGGGRQIIFPQSYNGFSHMRDDHMLSVQWQYKMLQQGIAADVPAA